MVQLPAVTPLTLLPLTVQTPVVVDVNVTARPDVAVAERVPLPPTATVGAAPKVIVWPLLANAVPEQMLNNSISGAEINTIVLRFQQSGKLCAFFCSVITSPAKKRYVKQQRTQITPAICE